LYIKLIIMILKRYYFQNMALCGNCNGEGLTDRTSYCRCCNGTGIQTIGQHLQTHHMEDKIYTPILFKEALKELQKESHYCLEENVSEPMKYCFTFSEKYPCDGNNEHAGKEMYCKCYEHMEKMEQLRIYQRWQASLFNKI